MQRHANGVVAWVMGLVGVLAVTGGGGCGNSGEAASETARLKEEVRSLREENVALKRDVFAANHKTGIEKDAVARLDRELAKLKKDHAQLEEDYTELAASIKPDGGAKEDAEKAKAKEKEKAEAARIAAAQAKAVEKVGEEAGSADENAARIKELLAQQEKAEKRIADLMVTISGGQAKISSLARATIDKRMEVPRGCFVERGNIYRRRLICGRPEILRSPEPWRVHRHTDACYSRYGYDSDLVGPTVIPGDFRTLYDRTAAINAIRAELAPVHVELRAIKEELGKVKAEVGTLTAAP